MVTLNELKNDEMEAIEKYNLFFISGHVLTKKEIKIIYKIINDEKRHLQLLRRIK